MGGGWRRSLTRLIVLLLTFSPAVAAGASNPRLHGAGDPGCYNYPAARDPANPLALAAAPGTDPLTGARFFVDGPARGAAGKAIAGLVGIDPTRLPVTLSWSAFEQALRLGGVSADPNVKIAELSKIAAQPEAQRISFYSGASDKVHGATGAEVEGQTYKIICTNGQADPGSVPSINTYFLHPAAPGRASRQQILAITPRFREEVDGMIAGIGRHPVVLLLEVDGIGSTGRWSKSSLAAWEDDLRYEVDRAASLPHAVVYVEAGYSDAQGPGYTAQVLNKIDIGKIRGFFTNDTHINWAIDEIRWAEKISRKTGGARYVVNTAQSGNGPIRRHGADRARNGNEVLCNPPGRALGPPPNTTPHSSYPYLHGDPHLDAFLWTAVPAASSGPCNGGPASGTFWPDRAVGLASRANDRVGPAPWPSHPY